MWTNQQRYCTACAAAVLLGFVLLAFYIDPTGFPRLNPFGGEECAPYEQQDSLTKQQLSHERLLSGEGRESGAERNADNAGPAAPDQGRSQGDYYACWLAVYTKQLALFTALLFFATLVLGGIGVYQGRWLANHARIARRALTEVERPYVFVSNIRWGELGLQAGYADLYLLYSVYNYGKTPAIIDAVSTHCGIRASPSETLLEDKVLYASPFIPANGEAIDAQIDIPGERHRQVDNYAIIKDTLYSVPEMTEEESAFFRIVIKYSGPFSSGHESSFCWKSDRPSYAFIQHGGDQYNYVK